MELLDRYLQAVKTFLPKARQDDILRELSENILSQMDDKEAELGRPLNEDEQAAIVKQHGHPMFVASRYRSRQHLIGPAVFPIYLLLLKGGLVGALAVYVVIATVAALIGPNPVQQIVQTLLKFPGVALYVFAWMTLVFLALDLVQAKYHFLDKWNPRSLPPVVKYADRIPRVNSAAELIGGAVALVFWWSAVPYFPYLVFDPAIGSWHLAPVWRTFSLAITLIVLAGMAQSGVNLLRPHWTQFRSAMRLATDAAALVIFYFLLNAHGWVVFTGAGAVGHAQAVQSINHVFYSCLLAAAFICVIDSLWHIRRLIVQSSSKLHSLGGFKTCV